MIPYIDTRVKHRGVSSLRGFSSHDLRVIKDAVIVICDNNEPLAVLLSYETYLALQKAAGIDNPFRELTPGAHP